jgi:hypothetical protein
MRGAVAARQQRQRRMSAQVAEDDDYRPATVSLSRTTASATQRGPAVAVRGKADGAHRPSWDTDASAYLHRRVTANGSSMPRLPFEGVLHCAPLP